MIETVWPWKERKSRCKRLHENQDSPNFKEEMVGMTTVAEIK